MTLINEQHKDRLFKFIFGNPDHKEWTLSLYNALNDTNFTDPEEIEFNTIEEAVYMGMRNDVSFILAFVISIWEHQSSFSLNLPIRLFLYAAHLYEKYITSGKFHRFSRKLQRLPKPKCICFYNGTEDQPEEVILKLSDAFDDNDGDIEVRVKMLNINYGRNRELMEKCRPIEEYSWFVEAVRLKQKDWLSLEQAVDLAIDEMSDDFALKKFLLMNRAEVKGMFLSEYDAEKEMEYLREEIREEAREEGREEGRKEGRAEGREEGRAEGRKEGRAEGRAEGRKEGRNEGINNANERVASDMLKNGEPLEKIKLYSQLAETAIFNLAKTLGISVM